MNKEQAEAILDGKDGCPFCKSGMITVNDTNFEGSFVSRHYKCMDCYRKWSVNYTMTDVQDDESNFTAKIDWDKVKIVETTQKSMVLATAINSFRDGLTTKQAKPILQQVEDEYGEDVADKFESYLYNKDGRLYIESAAWEWAHEVVS
jgi:transcriptional regulator NrdR family protein